MPVATAPIYSAAPRVTVDGTRDATLDASVLAVVVEETVDGLARCELTLSNWGGRDGQVGFLWFDRQVLDLGVELAVAVGDGDRAGEVFRGRVTGLEAQFPAGAAPSLVVLAEDGLQALRMSRRTRTFEDVSDADIIAAVCRDHGLTPQVEADGPTHRTVAQVNTSDLAFLRERARYLDADLRLDGRTLIVRARARRGEPVAQFRQGQDLRELTVVADLASQYSSVEVSGWDPAAAEPALGTAAAAAISGELDGGTSGPQLLGATVGERVERLAHLTPTTDAEATALAEHALRASARRFITATAVIEADARVRPGTRIALAGIGPLFNGRHDVVSVRHHVDEVRGALATVDLERAGLGGGS